MEPEQRGRSSTGNGMGSAKPSMEGRGSYDALLWVSRELKDALSYLQQPGPETDKNKVAKIRDAVNAGKSFCGRLLNYRKDGTPFWNLFTVNPIRDDNARSPSSSGTAWSPL
ncbi:phototropin-2-like [Triticum aestivum]|uniref:phototropin-2-like n=1 Tax=Triticum aestivum TaxID=4565 RepID=UPI001D008EC7|nr:phototropin-2-like [Triticum aestivum]